MISTKVHHVDAFYKGCEEEFIHVLSLMCKNFILKLSTWKKSTFNLSLVYWQTLKEPQCNLSYRLMVFFSAFVTLKKEISWFYIITLINYTHLLAILISTFNYTSTTINMDILLNRKKNPHKTHGWYPRCALPQRRFPATKLLVLHLESLNKWTV